MTAVPLSKLPDIPALAAGLATGTPDVSPFLPDRPDLATIAGRARRVLAAFHPRSRAAPGCSPELGSGRRAGVLTGQQVGLFTGPLLTLVKAIAATKLAGDLAAEGIPSSPVFWCAAEDHDLVEVTRVFLPSADGARDEGPDPGPLAGNRHPVGELPIDVPLAPLLKKAEGGLSQPADEAALGALSELLTARTFYEAFTRTLSWLLQEPGLCLADAARREDKPDLVPLALRLVRERGEVKRILHEREARLTEAGHSLQVTADPDALPLFVRVGDERCLLVEAGQRFSLKGRDGTWEEAEVLDKLSSLEWLPSFSALTRPLAVSVLFPVAATVLGPAEIAYWAQAWPLFEWAGIVPPVIIPRPMVALLTPATKRLLAKLDLDVADILEGRDAILRRLGAGTAEPTLRRLAAIRDGAAAGLDGVKPALLAIDPSLQKAVETTREKLSFAFEKLVEKAAEAAGRLDQTQEKQVSRLVDDILPDGRLAERVYSPLPWLLRFGREGLVEPIRRELRWNVPGLQVIELP